MEIIIPTNGPTDGFEAEVFSLYSAPALRVLAQKSINDAKNLFGAVRFNYDGDTEIVDADGNIKGHVKRLLGLLAGLPIGFLMHPANEIVPFQILAESAGGFLSSDEGTIGCVNEEELAAQVEQQISRSRALAQEFGIEDPSIEAQLRGLQEYFSLS